MPSITNDNGGLSALSAFRVIRLFRIFRIARLLHKVQSMRKLLGTVFHSISSIMHLSIFIMFTIVTASILATNLYSRPYPPSPEVAQVRGGVITLRRGGLRPSPLAGERYCRHRREPCPMVLPAPPCHSRFHVRGRRCAWGTPRLEYPSFDRPSVCVCVRMRAHVCEDVGARAHVWFTCVS